MPICPAAAANGVDDAKKLRAPHADGYSCLSPWPAHCTHQARCGGNLSLTE